MTASSERHAALAALLPFALLTILTTLLTVGKTTKLLEGLTYYLVPETEAEKARARLAQVQRSSTSARRRKGGKAPATDELGDESIAALRLTKANLVLRPFWAHFDHLVFFAAAISSTLPPPRWRRVGAASRGERLPMMCVVGAGARSARCEDTDPLTPAVEPAAAVAGAIGFGSRPDPPPRPRRRFGSGGAAELSRAHRRPTQVLRRAPAHPAGSWKISNVQTPWACPSSPACPARSSRPPCARRGPTPRESVRRRGDGLVGANALGRSRPRRLALPVVAAAHAAPLSALWGWDAETFSAFKAVAIAVAGATQLAATPGLVQGFLDGALVTWYELKHGEEARERGDFATVRAAARRKTEVTLHVACKVAVQSAAPAAAMISFACLLGAKRTDPAGEDTRSSRSSRRRAGAPSPGTSGGGRARVGASSPPRASPRRGRVSSEEEARDEDATRTRRGRAGARASGRPTRRDSIVLPVRS